MRGLQNNADSAVKLDGPSDIELAGGRPVPADATAQNMLRTAGAGDPYADATDLVNASDLGLYPNKSVVAGQGSLTDLNIPPDYSQTALGSKAQIPNTPPPGTQFPFPNTPPPGTQLPFPNTPPPGQGIFPPDYSQTALGEKALIPNTPPPGTPEPSLFDRAVSGTKNLYNEYLSPSRPGLAADAGIFTKYGPLAAVGTGAAYLAGAMDSEPVNQNPAFDRKYTGNEYIRDNPQLFSGGLGSYTRPSAPASPIVPTPSYGSIPIGQPGNIIPTGITNRPGGVAQPYNVAGLYGVPLIYGPDGQPRRMAKGGDAKMTDFPRRQGPIHGPGTGTSDDIPAMLSDGEFVFTAKAVRNAGGGSRRKGAARMYKLMKKLEGGAVKGK